MNHIGNWIMGAVTSIFAVGGLFVASNSGGEAVPYYGGLTFFVFGTLLVFYFIKVTFDQAGH